MVGFVWQRYEEVTVVARSLPFALRALYAL